MASKSKLRDEDILRLFGAYRKAGEEARKGAWGSRDNTWQQNVDIYFCRYDFSKKADWQSKQAMPEGASYIDRWAAAVRAALLVPGSWYTIGTPTTNTGQSLAALEPAFRKFLSFYLDRCATSPLGQPLGFSATFEDQVKMAALMAACGTVSWETTTVNGAQRGRVRVDACDPRQLVLDPTGRGMFRARRYEVDYYDLLGMTKAAPSQWNMEAIKKLAPSHDGSLDSDKEGLANHSIPVNDERKPITLEEWYAVIVDENGEDAYGDKQWVIVANDDTIIRGPERNPYFHGLDWLFFAPAIRVPLSVYGKTYVETWGDLALTFTMLTNMILDAARASALSVFSISSDALDDPSQIKGGITPNMALLTKSGYAAKDVFEAMPMGALSPSAVQIWQAVRQEMREGASTNDLDLGQVAPKGEVTATEINKVSQGSTALIQSIASSLETGCVDVLLNLIFMTALQHFDENDEELRAAIGLDYFQMFVTRRAEFAKLAPAFAARGLSGMIEKQQKLQQMLQLLQLMSSSPVLTQLLQGAIGMNEFIRQIITLIGLDPNDFPPEAPLMQPPGPAGGVGPGGPGGGSAAGIPPVAPTGGGGPVGP